MAYLVDSNVFIEAKNHHYGFDFCPAFWEWLVDANARKRAFSVVEVRAELEAGNDELADWAAAQRRKGFFLDATLQVASALARIRQWVAASSYIPAAQASFLGAADSSLIAYAKAHGYDLVTHEVRGNSRKRIKIPNVCDGFGVECVTPFEMLRRERARFVLPTAP